MIYHTRELKPTINIVHNLRNIDQILGSGRDQKKHRNFDDFCRVRKWPQTTFSVRNDRKLWSGRLRRVFSEITHSRRPTVEKSEKNTKFWPLLKSWALQNELFIEFGEINVFRCRSFSCTTRYVSIITTNMCYLLFFVFCMCWLCMFYWPSGFVLCHDLLLVVR